MSWAATGTGVFVLGMHRAGTSATTRAINLLGIPLGNEEELLSASRNNPTGFWEVERLVRLNDRLLHRLGGTPLAPPLLDPGWSRRSSLDRVRRVARRTFERTHGTERWVWKDPRNCVLFPFWREVLDVRAIVVLVHRDPTEVARSLEARSPRQGLSRALSLAAWERHMREALANVRGLPVHVTRYSSLVADPTGWARELLGFFRRQGLESAGPDSPEWVADFVESRPDGSGPASRARNGHGPGPADGSATGPDSDFRPSPQQHELLTMLDSLAGDHDAFAPPGLPPETGWVEPILAERRRAEAMRRQMRQSLRAARRRLRAAKAQQATAAGRATEAGRSP